MERTLNKHFRLLRQALSTTFINHLTLVTAKGLTRGLQHSLCRTSSSWALSIKFCQLLQDTTETTCMSCLSCRIANHGPETHTQVLLQGADSGLIYTATNKIFLMCCKVHYTSVTLDGGSELRKIQCIFQKKIKHFHSVFLYACRFHLCLAFLSCLELLSCPLLADPLSAVVAGQPIERHGPLCWCQHLIATHANLPVSLSASWRLDNGALPLP